MGGRWTEGLLVLGRKMGGRTTAGDSVGFSSPMGMATTVGARVVVGCRVGDGVSFTTMTGIRVAVVVGVATIGEEVDDTVGILVGGRLGIVGERVVGMGDSVGERVGRE